MRACRLRRGLGVSLQCGDLCRLKMLPKGASGSMPLLHCVHHLQVRALIHTHTHTHCILQRHHFNSEGMRSDLTGQLGPITWS